MKNVIEDIAKKHGKTLEETQKIAVDRKKWRRWIEEQYPTPCGISGLRKKKTKKKMF